MTATDPNDATPQRNGGLRPIPDPTLLTQAAVERSEKAIHEYVDGQLAIRDERLRGIDEATKLRMGPYDVLPHQVDEKVARLADLTVERFAGIQMQFMERDTRSERESRDNKVAVDAAFAAQKEAAAKQDEANAKAIDKSEKATAETIKTNQELATTRLDALTKNLDDLKLTVNGIASVKQGATENRTGLYAGLAALGAVIGIVLAIAAVLSTRGAA